ncbi:CAS1 appressorium specific protein [Metarhizium rileyi]|uniref:CAS1 appressorium specific protein n=1 Tax=Metarhizium rileyi (strain RCEF 4871) TaxID=1649241 RepID=A0A167HHV5_METRR|nr:CAS1 appressorium specific protein [Metarhizium rileyi RCEF 4871]
MSFKAVLATSALLASQLVSGHSVIVKAVGNAGGQGMALGVNPATPRDGTRRNPFQQDATRFRGANAQSVGETVGAGGNSVESGTSAIMSEMGGQLPQVTPGGSLQMTLHQVNGDGAGPYTCMINSDGTAQNWQNIQVTQNVEGNQRGRNNAGSESDHPLTVAIPANQQCTGQVAGQSNICMVRCQNPARAGPFGGVVPVQMAQAANNGAGAKSGINNGADGANGVDNGVNNVANGANNGASAKSGINNGADGANGVNNGVNNGANGATGVNNGANGVNNGANGVNNGANGVNNGANGVNGVNNGVNNGANGVNNGANGANGVNNGVNNGAPISATNPADNINNAGNAGARAGTRAANRAANRAGNRAGNGATRGNRGNNNNNNNDDDDNENAKRSMDVGAFVKRIDSRTRAVEFTV